MDGGIDVNCALDYMSFIGLIFTVSKALVFIGMCGVITRNFFSKPSRSVSIFLAREKAKNTEVIPELRFARSYLLVHNFRVSEPPAEQQL